MTSVRITPTSRSLSRTPADRPEPLRWSLKPQEQPTGTVDGAWWPRSRDLAAEAPALLTALAARLGAVEGVSYHLDDWEPTPRRITLGGARVRLAGYHSQHRDTIDVQGFRQRVTLLVVAPETPAPAARAAVRAAGDRSNVDGVETLLSTAPDEGGDGGDQRWKADGGPGRSAPPGG